MVKCDWHIGLQDRYTDEFGGAGAKRGGEPTHGIWLGFFLTVFEAGNRIATKLGTFCELANTQTTALAHLTQATQLHGQLLLIIEADSRTRATLHARGRWDG